MKKFIGGLQIVFGIFTLNTALGLVWNKIPGADAPLLTPHPSSTFETALIVMGAAIAIIGIIEKVRRMQFAEVQIPSGLAIAICSVYLYLDSTNGSYYYSPGSYWLVYLVMALGGLTAVAILAQFFIAGLKNEPGY